MNFSVNGKKSGKEFDGYDPKVVSSGPIELGVFEPKDGKFILREEVIGANSSSRGAKYFAGLDCVVVSEP
ncbi:MAG: hypothetical protein NTX50_07275 [Candidatus Sumerlaeota bacterium]|nr:hypothetical protein [Candidatus Sumerlaeota bacterium]